MMAELREFFDAKPDAWEMVVNLASHAENALVNAAAGKNELFKEALSRTIAGLRVELAPTTPLERLLGE